MITLHGVSKQFKNGSDTFYALEDISLTIPENRITIISGPSGSGKSTLLSILGLLQSTSSGEISFDNEVISYIDSKKSREFIENNISYVFQEFNLIDDFSVVDNLLVVSDDLAVIDNILQIIGLLDKKETPTRLLSGGEKQRLAIGRAIAKSGNIVLLDEPTGNLDEENGKIVFNLLRQFARNKTIVVVTHDLKLAYNYADNVILLNSGRLASTFSLSQNKFDIDFPNTGIDLLVPLIDLIKYQTANHPLKLSVKSETKEKSYSVTYNNILSSFVSIRDDFNCEKVSIEYDKHDVFDEKIDSFVNIKRTKQVFPFRFLAKYSGLLFKNKMWRNIASIILLILNIVMIFVYTNLATFDYLTPTRSAIVENQACYASPYILETNSASNTMSRYFSGKNLYGLLEESNIGAIPLIRVSSDINLISLSLAIIDEPVYFQDTLVVPPSLDSIVITDFVSYFLGEKTDITVSNSYYLGLSFITSLKVENTVSCNYNLQDLTIFENDVNYQSTNKDKFYNSYNVAFISSATFDKIKVNSSYQFSASNFFRSRQVTKQYADQSASYAEYSDQNLIAGRTPSSPYEVVVSKTFLERNKFYAGIEKIEDIIDQEFNYKDLESSPNRDIYQTTMNIYDITQKIKVVGVTDEQDDIYITETFMKEIQMELNYYLSGFFVNLKQDIDKIGNAAKYNIYYDLSYLEPIALVKNLSKTDLLYIVLVAIAIILVSTIIFLALTFILNVKDKYKEIAILKSFGISKKRIAGMFFLLNTFIAAVSLFLGFSLALVALHCINLVLMSRSVFNINYSILTMTPASFLLVILVTIVSTLISTLVALRKLNKIDVALALKMF